MKKIITLLFISVLFACAAYKPHIPVQADAERAAQKYPGATLADLEQGRAIFEEKCHKCHGLKKPFRKDEVKIAKVLPRMAHRAKLDSKQEALVLEYLTTMTPVGKSK